MKTPVRQTLRPTSLAVACLVLGAPMAFGQSTVSVPSTAAQDGTLATVVVTASGREQAIKEAPASITVITREELDRKPYANLQDVVRNLEGVNVVGASPQEKDISIRGMPGEYTLILVDGRRQGTRETMNRGTAGVQSNFIPPLSAIERIEVVRGPMSSLYGSDAMGGVINIITRKVPQQWGGSVSLGGVVSEDSRMGNSSRAEFSLAGPIKDDVVGLQIYGKKGSRGEDDYYYPNSATPGGNGQSDQSLTAKVTMKPAPNQDLSFEVGRESFSYISTPGRSAAAASTATTVLRTDHDRDHWALTHNGKWDFGSTSVSLYQETGEQTQRRVAGINPIRPEVTNTVLDGLVTLPFERHVLKAGVQLVRNQVKGIGAQDAAPGHGTNLDRVSLNSYALFAEDEFFVTDKFTLTAGVRMDDDDRYGRHWTPRVYGVYQLDPAWTVRGGVSKGFKAPTIRQSTPGYCMTTGGALGAVAGTLCGDPNLQPETSVSSELGLRFDQAGTFASFTLFHNAFRNKVSSYDTGVADPRSPGRNIYVYDNIDSVTLKGLEVGAGTRLSRELRVSGQYTLTDSARTGGRETAYNNTSLEGRPLDKTPRHVLSAQLDWTPSDRLTGYVSATYTSKQYWAALRNSAQGVRERPASATFDIGGSYAIQRNLSLKVALLNITDKVIPVDTRGRNTGLNGNWMTDEGRRLAVSLNATF